MLRIDGVVGNRHDDPDLADRIRDHERAGTLEYVRIDSDERKKSRLRVKTDVGTDLGIVVGGSELASGDVLFVDDERAIVVVFEARSAYVIELPPPSEATTAAAVELGHRVGNQHWDVAVEDGSVYVPIEADRVILEEVLEPYLPAGAETRYEKVDAELFIDETIDGSDHAHVHEGDHAHESNHNHGHGEDHPNGDDHAASDGNDHGYGDGHDRDPR